ncbi:MAG: hypothetical protein ABEI52_12780, partial [Halobacteriaceae archaeon]
AAYENVFYEAMQGNQTAFVRNDEIEAAWEVIEHIDIPAPFTYDQGTFPRQARSLIDWYKL